MQHRRAGASRRLMMGAQVDAEGVRFQVWAPAAKTVEVELVQSDGELYLPMSADGGVFRARAEAARAGLRYRYRVDGAECYPDPYSRFQPEGVHGPSEVVDPTAFDWHDQDWPGLSREGLVIYECHVGTYTPEGTFDALIPQLPELKTLGITALEVMPIAEFPGQHNWGYDGVDLYAPSHVYGGPEGFRRLVDAAHRDGIGVILDVVYNHLGPDGNYLKVYSPDYFTSHHSTPWGDALNYDGENSRWVREYAIANSCYWVSEFHVDGLRLDATHAIYDESSPHLQAEIGRQARLAAGDKSVVIIAENDANDVMLIRPPDKGGYGLDAVWADDFHHAVRVLLTGDREGYYEDYSGTTDEIALAIKKGFIYQGQVAPWVGGPRGSVVTDESASSFVFCLDNHDQVGNNPFGRRLSQLVDEDTFAAASVLLLLSPETPLIFQGQEFAASSPFLYFTDHSEELGKLVTHGRREEFSYLEAFRDDRLRSEIPDPQQYGTFLRSKLKLEERRTNERIYKLYRDLLELRRDDPVFSIQDRTRVSLYPLGERTIAMHGWNGEDHRLVIVNLGNPVELRNEELAALGVAEGVEYRNLFSTGQQSTATAAGTRLDKAIPLGASSALVLGWTQRFNS